MTNTETTVVEFRPNKKARDKRKRSRRRRFFSCLMGCACMNKETGVVPHTTDSELSTTDIELSTTYNELSTTYNELSTTDSVSRTTDSVLSTTDSVPRTTDSELSTTYNELSTTDSVSRTIDSVLSTTDSVPRTIDSVSRTIDSELSTTDSVSRTIDSVSRTIDSELSTTDSELSTTYNERSTTESVSHTTDSELSTTYNELSTIDSVSRTTDSVLSTTDSVPRTTDSAQFQVAIASSSFSESPLVDQTVLLCASTQQRLDGKIIMFRYKADPLFAVKTMLMSAFPTNMDIPDVKLKTTHGLAFVAQMRSLVSNMDIVYEMAMSRCTVSGDAQEGVLQKRSIAPSSFGHCHCMALLYGSPHQQTSAPRGLLDAYDVYRDTLKTLGLARNDSFNLPIVQTSVPSIVGNIVSDVMVPSTTVRIVSPNAVPDTSLPACVASAIQDSGPRVDLHDIQNVHTNSPCDMSPLSANPRFQPIDRKIRAIEKSFMDVKEYSNNSTMRPVGGHGTYSYKTCSGIGKNVSGSTNGRLCVVGKLNGQYSEQPMDMDRAKGQHMTVNAMAIHRKAYAVGNGAKQRAIVSSWIDDIDQYRDEWRKETPIEILPMPSYSETSTRHGTKAVPRLSPTTSSNTSTCTVTTCVPSVSAHVDHVTSNKAAVSADHEQVSRSASSDSWYSATDVLDTTDDTASQPQPAIHENVSMTSRLTSSLRNQVASLTAGNKETSVTWKTRPSKGLSEELSATWKTTESRICHFQSRIEDSILDTVNKWRDMQATRRISQETKARFATSFNHNVAWSTNQIPHIVNISVTSFGAKRTASFDRKLIPIRKPAVDSEHIPIGKLEVPVGTKIATTNVMKMASTVNKAERGMPIVNGRLPDDNIRVTSTGDKRNAFFYNRTPATSISGSARGRARPNVVTSNPSVATVASRRMPVLKKPNDNGRAVKLPSGTSSLDVINYERTARKLQHTTETQIKLARLRLRPVRGGQVTNAVPTSNKAPTRNKVPGRHVKKFVAKFESKVNNIKPY